MKGQAVSWIKAEFLLIECDRFLCFENDFETVFSQFCLQYVRFKLVILIYCYFL